MLNPLAEEDRYKEKPGRGAVRSLAGLLVFLWVMVCPLAAWGQDVWDGTADVTWYKDSESSFEITTPEQLAGLAQLVNGGNTFEGKTITLANDIVLNEGVLGANGELNGDGSNFKQWTPIGTALNIHTFKGTFDGQGHTISGIYINNTRNYQGLFGYVSDGKIQNLSVADSYIQAGSLVGSIVGYNMGAVSNCSNSGTVIGNDQYAFVGGIVGENNGVTVENCSNSGAVVSSIGTVGGITGFNIDGTVSSCSNSGTLTGEGAGIAGISYGAVLNCYYKEQEDLQGVGGSSGTITNVESKTTKEYMSGAVVRLLDPDGDTWGQKLDGESYPVPLGCLSEEERKACKIYTVTFTYTLPDGGEEGKEETITLCGNSDTPLVAPEETAEKGYAVTWKPALPETFGDVKEEETSFEATFAKLYTLTLTQPTEGGTISATVGETPVEGEVAEGATVTLKATPDAGYEFVEWSIEGVNIEEEDKANAEIEFTMPASDVTVTATFNAIDYNVTINETANGTVTADKTTAHMGDVVTLTVSPADGYELEDLTVEADGTPITVQDNAFTMPASNVTVTATFTEIEPEPEPTPTPDPAPEPAPTYYRVDLRPMTGATIIPSSRVVEEGGTLTFTIEIEEGYVADSMLVTVSQGIGKAVEVKPDEEGIYTVKNVDGLVTITVYGVKEATPVGVEDIEGVQVYSHEGAIYVYTPTEARVMIVAMNGVLKANEEQIGKRRYELPRGFYVVWVEGESFKVAN